jgi:hypothetical protein
VSDGGAFGGAAGELRQSALGANTLLQGDVNGDTGPTSRSC